MIYLKTCPCCGEEVEIKKKTAPISNYIMDYGYYSCWDEKSTFTYPEICCGKCNLYLKETGDLFKNESFEEKQIKLSQIWNNRTTEEHYFPDSETYGLNGEIYHNKIEYKSCPICGEKPIFYTSFITAKQLIAQNYIPKFYWYKLHCKHCGTNMINYGSEQELYEKWNNRMRHCEG